MSGEKVLTKEIAEQFTIPFEFKSRLSPLGISWIEFEEGLAISGNLFAMNKDVILNIYSD